MKQFETLEDYIQCVVCLEDLNRYKPGTIEFWQNTVKDFESSHKKSCDINKFQKSVAAFTHDHDEQWASVKNFIKDNGSSVCYVLSGQLIKAVKESDLEDREIRLINFFLMAVFVKVLYEVEIGDKDGN